MYNVIRTKKSKAIFIESGLPATKAEKQIGDPVSCGLVVSGYLGAGLIAYTEVGMG